MRTRFVIDKDKLYYSSAPALEQFKQIDKSLNIFADQLFSSEALDLNESDKNKKVYTEENIKEITNSFIEMIVKIFKNIKEIFLKFVNWLKGLVQKDSATVSNMENVVLPKILEKEEAVIKKYPEIKAIDNKLTFEKIKEIKIKEIKEEKVNEKEIKESIYDDYDKAKEAYDRLAVPSRAYYLLADDQYGFANLDDTLKVFYSLYKRNLENKFRQDCLYRLRSIYSAYGAWPKMSNERIIETLKVAEEELGVVASNFSEEITIIPKKYSLKYDAEQKLFRAVDVLEDFNYEEKYTNVHLPEQMHYFNTFLEYCNKNNSIEFSESIDSVIREFITMSDELTNFVSKATDSTERELISNIRRLLMLIKHLISILFSFNKEYYKIRSEIITAVKNVLAYTASSKRLKEYFIMRDYGYHSQADGLDKINSQL